MHLDMAENLCTPDHYNPYVGLSETIATELA